MQSLDVIVLGFLLVALQSCLCDKQAEYYWREFNGIIPRDAVPGGTDKTGKPLYIGQVYVNKVGLYPGTIYPTTGKIRIVQYGADKSYDTYTKILCAKDPAQFEWISMKSDQTHLLTNCVRVVGGFEEGQQLMIGRINHEQETLVAKVFGTHSPWPGLWIPSNGGQINFKTFELLTYGCQLHNYCEKFTFDVRTGV